MTERQPPHSLDQWNDAFTSGEWESREGRRQTMLFAQAWARRTQIPLDRCQTFIDVSCALGDALPIVYERWPHLELTGRDFSPGAVERARQLYGSIAQFEVGSIEDFDRSFDVVLCSHTLEHFADYRDKARHLMGLARYLSIFVPYDELRDGKDLTYDPRYDHVVTLRVNSFDFLVDEGLAIRKFEPRIFHVPEAWSWTLKERLIEPFKNLIRLYKGHRRFRNERVMLVEFEAPPKK